MEHRELKRFITDTFTVYLWKRGDFDVSDDLAYVAMLRIRQVVEEALAVLESPRTVNSNEE